MRSAFSSFFSQLSLVLLALVIVGFSSRAALFPDRLPPARLTLYVHIVVTGGWFVLLVGQTMLVNLGHRGLHRTIGRYSVALAAAIVVSGFVMVYENNAREFIWVQVISNSLNMITFAALFTLGIRHRRNPQFHKRMLAFASLAMMSPALARLSDALIGNAVLATPMWLVLLGSVLIFDRRTVGHITRASVIGLAVNLTQIVGTIVGLVLSA